MSDKHEQVIKAALSVMGDMELRRRQLLKDIRAAEDELTGLNNTIALMTYELKSLGVDVGMDGADLAEWMGELHEVTQDEMISVQLGYTHEAQ